LFLWLAMFGAVIALHRGEHMRLTAFASFAPVRLQGWLDAVSSAIVVACMLVLLAPAWDYIQNEWVVITPALRPGPRCSPVARLRCRARRCR
jgi:TRAP-type C4-dicarboxylate transport system permease small subunit